MDTANATVAPATNRPTVRKEVVKSIITLDNVKENEYQKPNTLTAQLRQTITTKSFYPSARIDSNSQQNMFDVAEFDGIEEQEFESTENRVAWLLVPSNSTMESVQARLDIANKKGACIYKVLSNEPVLDENQLYAIEAELRTKDEFAIKQAIRYPENEQTIEEGTAGKLTLDKNQNVQYRRTYLWLTPREDVDARDAKKAYVPVELKAELEGAAVMLGQTI